MNTETDLNWYKIRSRILLITLIFALGAGAVRFTVLANIGAQGTAVTRVRGEKESIRLENEMLRAQIDSIRTLDQVQKGIDQVFGQSGKKVAPKQITTSSSEDYDLLSLRNE